MEGTSKLRIKYKELVIKGKKKEAQKILAEIIRIEEKIMKSLDSKIKEPKKVVSKKKETLDNLSEIKGIGKETVEDMKKIYDSIESLKSALREDKVPLRNDVVKRLKKHLF